MPRTNGSTNRTDECVLRKASLFHFHYRNRHQKPPISWHVGKYIGSLEYRRRYNVWTMWRYLLFQFLRWIIRNDEEENPDLPWTLLCCALLVHLLVPGTNPGGSRQGRLSRTLRQLLYINPFCANVLEENENRKDFRHQPECEAIQ